MNEQEARARGRVEPATLLSELSLLSTCETSEIAKAVHRLMLLYIHTASGSLPSWQLTTSYRPSDTLSNERNLMLEVKSWHDSGSRLATALMLLLDDFTYVTRRESR